MCVHTHLHTQAHLCQNSGRNSGAGKDPGPPARPRSRGRASSSPRFWLGRSAPTVLGAAAIHPACSPTPSRPPMSTAQDAGRLGFQSSAQTGPFIDQQAGRSEGNGPQSKASSGPGDWQEVMCKEGHPTQGLAQREEPFFWTLVSEACTSLLQAWPGRDKTCFLCQKPRKCAEQRRPLRWLFWEAGDKSG